jgi:molecular chaperone GrpE (heat shock protein)
MLTEGPKAGAKKVIVLLAGAPSSFADKADMENFKKTLPPLLLQQNVLLFVVAMPTANVKLLELTAGLTGGKCLAALDLETMTDALDSIVNELQPPKEIVVEKQVPIKTVINQIQEMTPDERLARNREASFQLMIFVTVATTITVLLLFSIGLQWVLYRRMRPEKKSVRKDGNAAQKEKSSFAELRDLALALNNSVVDTGEMMEQLNLDLEDFGVEKWRREKQLEKRFSELALSLVLLLDHLRIQSDEVGAAADDRLRQRIERLLEDAKIHEIPVLPEDEFDGDLHKAVESVDSTLAGGRIVRVLRKGYQVGDSDKDAEALVLRQAEVAVSNNAAQKDTKGNKDV